MKSLDLQSLISLALQVLFGLYIVYLGIKTISENRPMKFLNIKPNKLDSIAGGLFFISLGITLLIFLAQAFFPELYTILMLSFQLFIVLMYVNIALIAYLIIVKIISYFRKRN